MVRGAALCFWCGFVWDCDRFVRFGVCCAPCVLLKKEHVPARV